jgi:acetylornithine deacetylase/succinyl-diaminopimelate desuccinylase family protein
MSTETYEVFPGRPNVVGGWDGSEERSLAINGHVDVVPAGDLSTWSVDPFGAELKDGRLYGRGSYDMKAGVAAAIAAATAIHDCGIQLAGRFQIHSVVDEESGGFGTQDVVRRGYAGSAVISAEPTEGRVVIAEGGLEWVRVVIRGRNAHAGWRYNDIYPQRPAGGRPTPGVNAAELAARFLMAVRELERQWGCQAAPHPLLPPGLNTINPGVVQVGSGVNEAGLPAVMTNPAMTPDLAVIDFDLKFQPNQRQEDVRREFEEFVRYWAMHDTWLRDHQPEVRWELGGLYFPPFDTPSDHPLVTAIRERREALGRPAELAGFVAVADAAFYAGAGATAVMHGHTGSGAHGADEWTDVQSIIDSAKVYAAAAIEYCGLRD